MTRQLWLQSAKLRPSPGFQQSGQARGARTYRGHCESGLTDTSFGRPALQVTRVPGAVRRPERCARMRSVWELVDELKSDRRLRAECPHFRRDFPLRGATVFAVEGPLPEEARELVRAIQDDLKRRREELRERRRRAREVPGQARLATEVGQALEALVPRLQDRLHPRDWRRLGDPIDFVVFDGLSATGRVQAVQYSSWR